MLGTENVIRGDDRDHPAYPAPQALVSRQQPDSVSLSEADVLGVVGLGPAKLSTNFACVPVDVVAGVPLDRRRHEPVEGGVG